MRLIGLLRKLQEYHEERPEEDQAKAAAAIHQDTVMSHFYDRVSRSDRTAFMNHKICYSCLVKFPEHALPCGHVICRMCLQAYGSMGDGRNTLVIYGCPFEPYARAPSPPWQITLKPDAAGIRILTLDG